VPSVRTVLVADDEFGILLVLEMALSDAGYRVVTAGNGRQALELASADPPDLVILDWMMPVMDGPTTAAAIRNDPVLARLPIVFMSGASESFLRSRFHDYSGFLHKPFLDEELLAVVAKVFAGATRSE
jgi:CheY-like chemotaxis protein